MSRVDHLIRASASVAELIGSVRPEQWTARTPCTDWTVARLVDHLIGMNLVFAAALTDQPAPRPVEHGADRPEAFRASTGRLIAAFVQPGVLDRTFTSPMGSTTGDERLQIRLYDLLAHGWDLAQAIGRPFVLPDDVAEASLAYARTQLSDQSRPGRFDPPQPVADDAPAIDRLAAFLGRTVTPVG
jgi:uncharacterized protein (TIGR03086 family)